MKTRYYNNQYSYQIADFNRVSITESNKYLFDINEHYRYGEYLTYGVPNESAISRQCVPERVRDLGTWPDHVLVPYKESMGFTIEPKSRHLSNKTIIVQNNKLIDASCPEFEDTDPNDPLYKALFDEVELYAKVFSYATEIFRLIKPILNTDDPQNKLKKFYEDALNEFKKEPIGKINFDTLVPSNFTERTCVAPIQRINVFEPGYKRIQQQFDRNVSTKDLQEVKSIVQTKITELINQHPVLMKKFFETEYSLLNNPGNVEAESKDDVSFWSLYLSDLFKSNEDLLRDSPNKQITKCDWTIKKISGEAEKFDLKQLAKEIISLFNWNDISNANLFSERFFVSKTAPELISLKDTEIRYDVNELLKKICHTCVYHYKRYAKLKNKVTVNIEEAVNLIFEKKIESVQELNHAQVGLIVDNIVERIKEEKIKSPEELSPLLSLIRDSSYLESQLALFQAFINLELQQFYGRIKQLLYDFSFREYVAQQSEPPDFDLKLSTIVKCFKHQRFDSLSDIDIISSSDRAKKLLHKIKDSLNHEVLADDEENCIRRHQMIEQQVRNESQAATESDEATTIQIIEKEIDRFYKSKQKLMDQFNKLLNLPPSNNFAPQSTRNSPRLEHKTNNQKIVLAKPALAQNRASLFSKVRACLSRKKSPEAASLKGNSKKN